MAAAEMRFLPRIVVHGNEVPKSHLTQSHRFLEKGFLRAIRKLGLGHRDFSYHEVNALILPDTLYKKVTRQDEDPMVMMEARLEGIDPQELPPSSLAHALGDRNLRFTKSLNLEKEPNKLAAHEAAHIMLHHIGGRREPEATFLPPEQWIPVEIVEGVAAVIGIWAGKEEGEHDRLDEYRTSILAKDPLYINRPFQTYAGYASLVEYLRRFHRPDALNAIAHIYEQTGEGEPFEMAFAREFGIFFADAMKEHELFLNTATPHAIIAGTVFELE